MVDSYYAVPSEANRYTALFSKKVKLVSPSNKKETVTVEIAIRLVETKR